MRAGFRSVLIRGAVASGIFFIFLLVVARDSPVVAFGFTAVLFVLMIPLGMLLDRVSHRLAMRRWEKRRAGG